MSNTAVELEDLYEDDWSEYEEYEFEMPDSDGSHVVLMGPEKEVDIAGTHLYYREGEYLQIDDDGGTLPDWSLTCFYEDKEHPENYLYIEQDPPETAMHNLTHILMHYQECPGLAEAAN